jgi:hypothetical protein
MANDRVTATQSDSSEPGADEWRPVPSDTLAAKERSEFLNSWGSDKPLGGAAKPARGKAPPVEPDEDADLDDADSDDDEDEEVDAVETAPRKPAKVAEPAEDEDEDEDEAAEDEDEDEDADLDEDEKPGKSDPVVAKGLAKLQKQEARMRQALDRERASWQAEAAKERETIQAERIAAAEAKSVLEKIRARAKLDPMGALEELGLEDFEYAGKQAYLRGKAATDPAYKDAVARLTKDRERDAELGEIKKKLAERERAEADEKTAQQQREANAKWRDAFIGGVTKAVASVPKATLAQSLVKSDPEYAKARFAEAASALWQRDGIEPKPRDVVIAVEKLERQLLRRHGIDPRTMTAVAQTRPPVGGKSKPGKGKKAAARSADDKELARPTREQLLAEEWTR